MDAEQYAIMHEVERSHWWYRGMRRRAIALLREYLPAGRSYDLLDAGCGTGGTTIDLLPFGRVTGIDFSADALAFAGSRGLGRLLRGSLEALPFADGSFDAWTCFDVLYHRAIRDPHRALVEARRVLRPGGIALSREPAFDWLRGAHDVGIHTQRRYTTAGLARAMREAGFRVEYATYGNMILFPLAVVKRSLDRLIPAGPTDLSVPPSPINRAFEAVLSLEGAIAQLTPLPIGLSTIVVGRA